MFWLVNFRRANVTPKLIPILQNSCYKSKGMVHFHSATFAALLPSGAVVTEPAYSPGHSPSPRSRTLACSYKPYVGIVCRFNGYHLQNPRKYTDYYSVIYWRGMEGWVGLVGLPINRRFTQRVAVCQWQVRCQAGKVGWPRNQWATPSTLQTQRHLTKD